MKIRDFIPALCILMSALCVSSATAATPTIEASISPDSVGIGDRFTYTLTVKHDLMQVVAFPEFSDEKGGTVELIESCAVDTLSQDGRELLLEKRYILTAFEEGRVNMGVGRVLYLDKNITDTLSTSDSLYVEVGTFEIDSTSQLIYELKELRTLPLKFAEIKGYLMWSVILLLILFAVIYALSKYLATRGKSISDLFKPTPPPPPHVEAIKALEELHNQKLWQNEKFKEYYSSLTHIIRHYVARRYEVAAMEMTSEEIIEAMRSVDLPNKSRMDLTSLLRDADLVKFAKATPEGEENEASYYKVYYFVEETKIQEEVDPASAEEEIFDVSGKSNKD